MQVIESVDEIKSIVKEWKKQNLSIGFVPTMGFLHSGHLSLIKAARKHDKLVVSIFVNPLQFGANEDLDKYPRDLQKDSALCEKERVDVLFVPSVAQMYPAGFSAFVDMHSLTDKLCGASRKGHFKGVCTVLTKFFNLIKPNKAYFGQKDAQQCAVVRQMVSDLNMSVEIEICPIVRENDGLAKSSRNVYLSESERKAALVLSRAVFLGEKLVKSGEKSAKVVEEAMRKELSSEKLARIDYVSIVNANTIQSVQEIKGDILGAIAVYIGKTRLIDNFLLRDVR